MSFLLPAAAVSLLLPFIYLFLFNTFAAAIKKNNNNNKKIRCPCRAGSKDQRGYSLDWMTLGLFSNRNDSLDVPPPPFQPRQPSRAELKSTQLPGEAAFQHPNFFKTRKTRQMKGKKKTRSRDVVALAVLRERLDATILRIFPNLNHSVILHKNGISRSAFTRIPGVFFSRFPEISRC